MKRRCAGGSACEAARPAARALWAANPRSLLQPGALACVPAATGTHPTDLPPDPTAHLPPQVRVLSCFKMSSSAAGPAPSAPRGGCKEAFCVWLDGGVGGMAPWGRWEARCPTGPHLATRRIHTLLTHRPTHAPSHPAPPTHPGCGPGGRTA